MPSSEDITAATNDSNSTNAATPYNSISSPTHTVTTAISSSASTSPHASQPRMRLRRFRLSDIPIFHLALSDPETMRYESFLAHTTLHQSENYVKKILKSDEEQRMGISSSGLRGLYLWKMVVEVSEEVMKEVKEQIKQREERGERKTDKPKHAVGAAATFSSATASSSLSSLPAPIVSAATQISSPPSSSFASSSSLSQSQSSESLYHTVGEAICYQSSDLRYNIGYTIFRQYWRCGLATEAVGTLIEYVLKEKFDSMSEADKRGKYIWADIDPRNIASTDLLQKKFGFLLLGDAKNTIQVGEEWVDSVYLGVDRENFDKSQWKVKYLEQHGELPKIVL